MQNLINVVNVLKGNGEKKVIQFSKSEISDKGNI